MKTFEIIGRKYDTVKKYADWDKEKIYFHYEKIDEITMKKQFKNLHEAKKWMLENLPNYYFGCNIIEDVATGADFLCACVPEYYEREFNTSDRNYIIKELLRGL